ncbi:tRNA (adenosine(37)-N6)-threonylcarbamoyltransferase complex transferase subunit TsaD [Desulfovibrio sp. SGI.169]|uniref:tRNA (adenosine(37)-N6)-threonylcarbamoyltransferase complex transferase subunit TsaD n=1 Tax=Desulfovibrio sp. SGI.169 TaxID=3420561 RepID=UPI003D076BFD
MLCLGIESSCDETALALVEDGRLLGSVLASQADVHALFGGVVPELASREHYRCIGPLFDELMRRCRRSGTDITLVSVARGPGLLGSLLVGVAFAKGLALGLGARFLGLNHLHTHLLAVGLEQELTFPCLGLLVSGGHTHIYRMEAPWRCQPLGRTLDDAAGEAFDKVGKLLGLTYPGGRLMDALARAGRADAGLFPRPYLDNDNLDFSFSGLKTAVASYMERRLDGGWPHPLRRVEDAPQALRDCCASFNLAVVDTLCVKVSRALDRQPDLRALIVAGGVAANSLLRERMEELMRRRGGKLLTPSPLLCTDNAAMTAYAGWLLGRAGFQHDLSMETIPRGRAVPDDMVCRAEHPQSGETA